ncbi:LTA synthase family protein [Collinsella intestinalis]|uniref:LTA synthase family protein n=1 Tax=Collinsella intestinalis TaxID=147207 RepID=UPI00267157BE|nr:LTA synthase family protein [Collinsella intestinalis]
MGPVANRFYSLMPFVSAVLIVVISGLIHARARKKEKAVLWGNIIWPIGIASISLFLAIWNMLGLVEFDFGRLDFAIFSVLMVLFGIVPSLRVPLHEFILACGGTRARILAVLRGTLVLIGVAGVSAWMIDFAWLGDSYGIAPVFIGTSFLIILSVLVALFFLGQRTGALALLVPLASFGFGVAQHFVLKFKGTAILPSDLLILGTAAEVSSGYDFVLSQWNVYALCVLAACLSALSLLVPIGTAGASVKNHVRSVGVNCLVSASLAFGLLAAYDSVNLEQALDAPLNRWLPIDTYQNQGFLLGFIEMAQDLEIPVPDGYSDQSAEKTKRSLVDRFNKSEDLDPARINSMAQFYETRPSVVVVMNESFSDLSLHRALSDAGYSGPQFYNSLSDVLYRGTFMASVVGGATANTEFEFLTGASTAFLGSYKYPYQLYDFSDVDSLPRQLSQLGYDTTAMHPMNGANYNRTKNYQRLGFDRFLDIEAFPNAEVYHAGAKDRVTYDKILDILKEDEGPQFIFDVTMQNHGGYAEGTVPAEDLVDWAPDGLSDGDLAIQLNTYLACVEQSDRDLEYFVQQLREIGRPVVLVFFGDHQPNFSAALNDALNPNEETLAHEMRTYESTYMVWANYDISQGSDDPGSETSASQLASRVLYRMGAPLTDYQKAQIVLGSDIQSVNLLGYRGADGLRYELQGSSPYEDSLNKLQAIQYLAFAEKVI